LRTKLVTGAEVDAGCPAGVVGPEIPRPRRGTDSVAGPVRHPEHRRDGHGEDEESSSRHGYLLVLLCTLIGDAEDETRRESGRFLG